MYIFICLFLDTCCLLIKKNVLNVKQSLSCYSLHNDGDAKSQPARSPSPALSSLHSHSQHACLHSPLQRDSMNMCCHKPDWSTRTSEQHKMEAKPVVSLRDIYSKLSKLGRRESRLTDIYIIKTGQYRVPTSTLG